MSSDEKPAFDGANDPYREAEEAAERIYELVAAALEAGEEERISDEAVRLMMTAAVKLYARKADGGGRTFRPLKGQYDEVVTPTEALTATTEVLRALRLGPMEFGLWSRRRPEDYHLTPEPDATTTAATAQATTQAAAKEPSK